MPRTFAYARVSTIEQEPENQVQEINAAGFKVEPHRIISETISGSVVITQRKGFVRLLDKMETGDILVVTKLDRLGRPPALSVYQQKNVRERLSAGESVSSIARDLKTSRQTIMRVRDQA